ncbi:hypothetical protein GCM10007877_33060 [Marinibactrum halimedae]|uniref:Uncharacterized protein n=1 Tax=Marinibactrum halimedae TaxID=1444977 RepID=A0AA37T9Y2_9GAMM|nr:hypothetical protein GCM10007877_33060 [Marinibactrum halimedae]
MGQFYEQFLSSRPCSTPFEIKYYWMIVEYKNFVEGQYYQKLITLKHSIYELIKVGIIESIINREYK